MKLSGESTGSFRNQRPVGGRRALGRGIWAFFVGLIVLAGAVNSACQRSVSGDRYQIPWPDANGEYHEHAVRIESFDDPEHLSGRYSKIVVSPNMQNGSLTSDAPTGRFTRTSEGVKVPLDYATLQGTAVAAHMERLSHIDEELGVKLDWPMRLAIEANLQDNGHAIRDNAVFDSDIDALLISPYEGSALPIALNGGVLAHEHFHKIFETLVLSHLEGNRARQVGCTGAVASGSDLAAESDPVIVYNNFYLRAINEGLADFWGWVYTGDAGFIGHSLPLEAKRRSLGGTSEQLKTAAQLQVYVHDLSGAIMPATQITANAYAVGNQYARVFRALAQKQGSDSSMKSRLVLGGALMRALPEMATAIAQAQKAHSLISPNVPLQALLKTAEADKRADLCAQVSDIAAPELEHFSCGEAK